MVVVQLLTQFVTAVLGGYLAFSTHIVPSTHEHIHPEPTQQQEIDADSGEAGTVHQGKLQVLHPEYEFGGAIPKILIESAEYQKAAVSDAAREVATATPTHLTLASTVEDALVNIYCSYKTDSYERITTGTGFFINKNGVLLTNAHVAQFLLLSEAGGNIHDAHCFLRGGDPAEPLYKVELLYISPIWVNANVHVIAEEHPTGTGERDYALLYVSEPIGNNALPAEFPVLPTDSSLLSRYTSGTRVLAGGFPATADSIQNNSVILHPTIASTTVGELYTFGSNYADVFDISSSTVGARGSSGGPIVRSDGKAIGLIVTKGDSQKDGGHGLRAITLSYIDRTIREETGFSLIQNTSGDIAHRGAVFRKVLAPFLSRLLSDELSS